MPQQRWLSLVETVAPPPEIEVIKGIEALVGGSEGGGYRISTRRRKVTKRAPDLNLRPVPGPHADRVRYRVRSDAAAMESEEVPREPGASRPAWG